MSGCTFLSGGDVNIAPGIHSQRTTRRHSRPTDTHVMTRDERHVVLCRYCRAHLGHDKKPDVLYARSS